MYVYNSLVFPAPRHWNKIPVELITCTTHVPPLGGMQLISLCTAICTRTRNVCCRCCSLHKKGKNTWSHISLNDNDNSYNGIISNDKSNNNTSVNDMEWKQKNVIILQVVKLCSEAGFFFRAQLCTTVVSILKCKLSKLKKNYIFFLHNHLLQLKLNLQVVPYKLLITTPI